MTMKTICMINNKVVGCIGCHQPRLRLPSYPSGPYFWQLVFPLSRRTHPFGLGKSFDMSCSTPFTTNPSLENSVSSFSQARWCLLCQRFISFILFLCEIPKRRHTIASGVHNHTVEITFLILCKRIRQARPMRSSFKHPIIIKNLIWIIMYVSNSFFASHTNIKAC